MKRATFRFWLGKKFIVGMVVSRNGEPAPNSYFGLLTSIAKSIQNDFGNIREIIFMKVKQYEAKQEFVKIWGNYKPSKPFKDQINKEHYSRPQSLWFFKNVNDEALWNKHLVDAGEIQYDIIYKEGLVFPKVRIHYLGHSREFTHREVLEELLNVKENIWKEFQHEDDWLKDCDCKNKNEI